MSAILGVFSVGRATPRDAVIRGMLDRMNTRGSDRAAIWREGSAVLAAARYEWELAEGFSGRVLVVQEGNLAVAADASLYYRADLRRALTRSGIRPQGDSPSHLILAAYEAWGEECVQRLEGDFAFLLWDGERRRLFGSRDYGGSRPLYYAEVAGGVIAASTPSALLAHPDCPVDLNLSAIAQAAAGLFAASEETCYRAISLLPAGCNLCWDEGGVRIARHWDPLPQPRSRIPFAAAAEELRELLCRSVAERLAPAGPSSVWLSGGYDSTAVFAAGEKVLAERGEGQHLHAISVSYPPGDPGREDELIQAVVDRWGSPVRWLDIADIPLLERAQEGAAARDEPFAHSFEMWNRALAAGSRREGARVAFAGAGGDPLFAVTPIYLADLFRSGRWISLAREWRAKGMSGSGFRNFFRWSIQPTLPPPLLRAASHLRGGRPLRGYLEPSLPDWIDRQFVAEHRLVEREKEHTPLRNGRSHAQYEMYWYLQHPYGARICSTVSGFALENGVEMRLPLWDRRVIEFAMSRPREERASGRETKRLLRAAMRGLIPEEVLAPRPFRTGLTSGYFRRSMREAYARLLVETFESPLLARFGIVDAATLQERCRQYLCGSVGGVDLHLFMTLQAELWLRAHAEEHLHAIAPQIPLVAAS